MRVSLVMEYIGIGCCQINKEKHRFVRTLFGSIVRFFFTRTDQQSHAGSPSTCIFLYDIWNNTHTHTHMLWKERLHISY